MYTLTHVNMDILADMSYMHSCAHAQWQLQASADGTFVLPGEVPQAVSTSWIRGIGNSGVNFLRTSHLEATA